MVIKMGVQHLDKETMDRMLNMFKHLKPRDPARIPRLLKTLEKVWLKYPDMRFFQLLENIFGCPKLRNHCFFMQEDDVTETRLKTFKESGIWGEHG